LPPAFTLVSCSAYSTLRMEATCFSETPVYFQRSVGLLEGWNKGGRTIVLWKVAVQGPVRGLPLMYPFIHAFIHIPEDSTLQINK
jgi:hypothetical protein